MTRDAGQITTRETFLGVVATILAVLAIVAGAEALLRPSRALPPVEGPPSAPPLPCPAAREVLPRSRAALPLPPGPVPVTSADLVECPTTYDGRTVVYEGEVVRAVLRRGQRAWVQLNDDRYGMEIGPLPEHRVAAGANSGVAVSIPATDADRIRFVGDARARGDRLRVRGTFLRADPADAGGPAIRAHTVEVTEAGAPVEPTVTPARVVVALLLAAAAAAMARAARRSADR